MGQKSLPDWRFSYPAFGFLNEGFWQRKVNAVSAALLTGSTASASASFHTWDVYTVDDTTRVSLPAFLTPFSAAFQPFQKQRETANTIRRFVVLLCCPEHTRSAPTCSFRLEEGRYLILHKAGEPFVTLLRAADGRAPRGSYNLQQIHGAVPQPPASGLLPWIPVDPAVVLPFHRKHGQVPCTFPVKALLTVCTAVPRYHRG